MSERVTITVDGQPIEADKGDLLIKVAQDHGVYIPRFCWHERMKPVGMCRMCLVEIEGQRGLPPACTATVSDGMVVTTQSAAVKKAQEGTLEFLLINHPLDCPVCDRGGECPLQDHTLAFGPGESRFVEEKRHFAKPIAISELVYLDRERCILCARCTRFADEVAGDPLISFVERGGHSQVLTFPDDPFTSYFSGNTVQICPVGALTAKPYRFRARPWDLAKVETTCQLCSVGCRGELQSTSNQLVRFLGVDSEPVNHGWLCDKGRFGFEYVHSDARVSTPKVRKAGELLDASWSEALDEAAERLAEVIRLHGPESVAVIGGARGTNEDAYVWNRFAKSVLRTDNVDCQVGDGLPAEVVLGLPRATIADADAAKAIVLLAPDLKEELPVLYLRIRRAAAELGVPLIEISSRDTGLTRHAAVKLRHLPGEQGDRAEQLVEAVRGGGTLDDGGDAALAAAAEFLRSDGEGDVIVVLGRPSLAERPELTVRAAAALALLPRARFLSALRRGNVHGGLDMGLAPGMLPGRIDLEGGRDWFSSASAWSALPETRGLDTEGVLRSATQGKMHALIILGSNVVDDFPDQVLARRGLESIGTVIAVGAFTTTASRRADVVLPAQLWGEKAGSTTNLEGRVARLAPKVTPAGMAMADWRIASELALRFGVDFDLESIEDVQAEIARLAPSHRGIDGYALHHADDGIVVPMQEHEVLFSGAPPSLTPALADPAVGSADSGAAPFPDAEPSGAPAVSVGPPLLYEWDRSGGVSEAPALDAYSLRLVSSRKLYDNGLAVTQTAAFNGLAPGQVLVINPTDRERIGVAEGGEVKVTSAQASLVLPVRSEFGTPKGTAWIPFQQPGTGASELIDSSAVVTDLRVETLDGKVAKP